MFQLLLAMIYLAFISLGLPDSLLGSAWPSMYPKLDVPISYAGILSMIIAAGTVISSLQSDRLTRRFGAGKITAVSVAMTAAALFGFSVSQSFWMLCIWAVPYGLGAGSVDAALNNYVAIHYQSRHMSWLHCMWGVGAMIGPNLIGYALSHQNSWRQGYWYVGVMQTAVTILLFFSLPLWKEKNITKEKAGCIKRKGLGLKEVVQIPGAKEVMICFFCYSAVEQTTILWASSYLTICKDVPAETAAGFASLFFIGITVGRAGSGFLTMRLHDTNMIRLGESLIGIGILIMFLPGSEKLSLAGLVVIGLGCAPIYPSIIHSTPGHFGAEHSQAVIGVEMASAYVGTCLMPPFFGIVSKYFTAALLPVYLLAVLILMSIMHESLVKKTSDLTRKE